MSIRFRSLTAIAGISTLLTASLSAQCLEGTHFASDGELADGFGTVVEIEQDTMMVGARFAGGPGAAYVFERGPSGWVEQQRIEQQVPTGEDHFGSSLDFDGEWAIVGAPLGAGSAPSTGCAYIYRWMNGEYVESQRLYASVGTAHERFGLEVAIHGDVALVAAGQFDAGSVTVFERTGPMWFERGVITPADSAPGDSFGSSLLLQPGLAIIGAPGADAGQGAVYTFAGGGGFAFIERDKLTKVGPADVPNFGHSLAIDGSRLAVGSMGDNGTGLTDRRGSVDLYQQNGFDWNHEAEVLQGEVFSFAWDDFGSDVSLEGDLLLVSGANYSWSTQGSQVAYAFLRDAQGAWNKIARFAPPVHHIFGEFGAEVKLDGGQVVVAEPGDIGGTWLPQGSVHTFSLATMAVPYCFCDANAPCGNEDQLGGCENSSGAGAVLRACGTGSVSADDMILITENLPSGQSALSFMGGAEVSMPFTYGRLCVGPGQSGYFRFPVQSSGSDGSIAIGPGLAAHAAANFSAQGQFAAGATWHFQTWFRDNSGACGSGSNTSNALAVRLVP